MLIFRRLGSELPTYLTRVRKDRREMRDILMRPQSRSSGSSSRSDRDGMGWFICLFESVSFGIFTVGRVILDLPCMHKQVLFCSDARARFEEYRFVMNVQYIVLDSELAGWLDERTSNEVIIDLQNSQFYCIKY